MTAKHRPSDASREIVARAASFGFTEEQIAQIVGCSDRTLRKWYKRQLATGHLEANHKVAEKLYDLCMRGDRASIFFWMKTRAGWRENDPTVTVNANANAAAGVVVRVPMEMDSETWNKLAAEHASHVLEHGRAVHDALARDNNTSRPLPQTPLETASTGTFQQEPEADCVIIDGVIVPNPRKQRRRRWSQGPIFGRA